MRSPHALPQPPVLTKEWDPALLDCGFWGLGFFSASPGGNHEPGEAPNGHCRMSTGGLGSDSAEEGSD